MSAESMMFNGAVLCSVLILVGLSLGFLILQIQGGEPEYIELDFEHGDCVAVDGVAMTPAQVMKHLNKLAGKHGIGRVDLIENRFEKNRSDWILRHTQQCCFE